MSDHEIEEKKGSDPEKVLIHYFDKDEVAANIKEMVFSESSRFSIHKHTSIPLRTLDSYMKENGSEPKLLNIYYIAQSLGTTIEFLAFRNGPKKLERDYVDEYWSSLNDSTIEKTLNIINIKKSKGPFSSDYSNYFSTIYEKFSDESGQESPKPSSQLFNDIEELLAKSGSIERQKAYLMAGDNMAPDINDGDLIIVDSSQTDLTVGKFFYFETSGIPYVRRALQEPGKGWALHNVNEGYGDPIYMDDDNMIDTKVVGRVISVQKTL